MLPPSTSDFPKNLVGRTEELSRVKAFAARLRDDAHRGGAVLVSGPQGMGKSAFLEELKRHFGEVSAAVIECRCHPNDDRPNGVFVELFAESAELLRNSRLNARPLERALDRLTGIADQTDVSVHPYRPNEHLRLSETVRSALVEVSTPNMPVVIIHDLHWADHATVNVLRYLFDNLLSDPVFDWTNPAPTDDDRQNNVFNGLVICSFRENEITRSLVEAAAATDSIELVRLEGLNDEGIIEFLNSGDTIARLRKASGGNPQVLRKLINQLPENPEDLSLNAGPKLDAVQVSILDVLAVVARPCSLGQIREFSVDSDQTVPAVDALVQSEYLNRHLVRGRPYFYFAQQSDGIQWLHAMKDTDRKRIHLKVAERLAAGFDAEPEQVARHFLAADHAADAVPFVLLAAERLQAALAYDRAMELLERIHGVTEDTLQVEVGEQLGELYSVTGHFDKAKNIFQDLRSLVPERSAEFDGRLAHILMQEGDYAGAQTLVDDRLQQDIPDAVRRGLLDIAADAAYRLGDLSAAESYCEHPALKDADPLQDASLSVRNTLGKVRLFREDFDAAECLFKDNLAAAQSAGSITHQGKALINLGVVQLQRGNPEDALSHFEDARRLSEAWGDLSNLSISLENLAVLYHRRQAFRDALIFYHQSTATSRRLGRRQQLTTSVLNLADLYLTVGDIERARRLADIAGEYIRTDGLRFLETQNEILAGDIARALGDVKKAGAHYTEAIAQIERGAQTNQRLGSLLWSQAELCLESEQLSLALKHVEQALALPSPPSESLSVRLRMTLGSIHAARGNLTDGIQELEASVHGAAEHNDREAVWQTRYRLAMAYWKHGDLTGARTLLSRSLEVIERVAAELPSSLRSVYRGAPLRRAVRDSLRRLRAGLSPLNENISVDNRSARRQRATPGIYRTSWADRYPAIIGRSPALFPVFKALDRVSGSDSMVLVRGESGTGKELVAAALHQHSPRGSSPFVKVNCAAFVETLLLSELFGHEKGAFTGAVGTKKGRFELAHSGTLFLDEIGDISPNTQVALLRVLQEGAFERVGGQDTISVDVRVICATHRNLEEMVKDGTFRADLYYRLRGVIIELPALRDRPTDIPLLVSHFLRRQKDGPGKARHFDQDALASLFQHDWPGNIRELENVVRSVSLFADGATVTMSDLRELGDILPPPSEAAVLALSEALESVDLDPREPLLPPAKNPLDIEADFDLLESPPVGQSTLTGMEGPPADIDLSTWVQKNVQDAGGLGELKKRIEFEAIAGALKFEKGNITRAAKRLGMKRPRLSQIIHAHAELGTLKEQLTDSDK